MSRLAPEELFERNLGLVTRSLIELGLARDAEVEDLEQEARLALLKAAQDFDPEAGYKFSSFAIPRIRGAILEYRRSKCSWVKRSGQLAFAAVERATLTLELQALPVTEEAIRALLEHPGDLERARALPTLVSLLDEDGNSLVDAPAGGPDIPEEVWAREARRLVERALRRLTAKDRAVFRGRVERRMTAAEVGQRLDMDSAEVAQRHRNSLATIRRYLKRVSGRLAEKTGEESDAKRPQKSRDSSPVVQPRLAEERFQFYPGRHGRERLRQLAAALDVSEGEVCRRAVEAYWKRQLGGKRYPEDERLRLEG